MANPNYTSLADLGNDLAKLIGSYSKSVTDAVAKGVDESANIFIKKAETGSPRRIPEYYSCWAIKPMQKAKYVRYVGNTKKVKGKNNTQIPLINILEFSKTRGHPHVKDIIENSKEDIINCMMDKIGNAR